MKHLSRETLSQIVDDGLEGAEGAEGARGAGAEARAHLAECVVCRRELDAIRRLKAGLRVLSEPAVPDAVWAAVERRLTDEGLVRASQGGAGGVAVPARFRVPLQAAAVVALLVAGFGAGRLTAPASRFASVADSPPRTVEEALQQVEETGAAYRRAVAYLESVGSTAAPETTPQLAAERVAALDAFMDVTRAALRVAPDDPVINGYLYAAFQERQRLVSDLGGAAQPVSDVIWR